MTKYHCAVLCSIDTVSVMKNEANPEEQRFLILRIGLCLKSCT